MNESRYIPQLCFKKNEAQSVYAAIDSHTGCKVLVKTISRQADPILQRQFEIESTALARFKSPWIPALLDLQEAEEQRMLVETYMEGESLEEWLKHNPSRRQRRTIFCQLCDLVQQVHEAGYLYLDLKSDNIKIQQGHAVLIDFNSLLPIGFKQSLLTNAEACPPEIEQGFVLSVTADQVGLGAIHRRLFGLSRIYWISRRKDPARRFSSLQAMKEASRPLCLSRTLYTGSAFVLCFLLLSLRFVYSKTSEPSNLAAGQWLEQLQENRQSRNPSMLAVWAYESLEEQPEGSLFLADPIVLSAAVQCALEAESQILAEYIVLHAPAKAAASLQQDWLKLLDLAQKPLNSKSARLLLNSCQQESRSELLAGMARLFLSSGQIPEKDVLDLYEKQLQLAADWTETECSEILSWLLLLKAQAHLQPVLPESFVQCALQQEQSAAALAMYLVSS